MNKTRNGFIKSIWETFGRLLQSGGNDSSDREEILGLPVYSNMIS